MTITVKYNELFLRQSVSNRELYRLPETPIREKEAYCTIEFENESIDSNGYTGNIDFSTLGRFNQIYLIEIQDGTDEDGYIFVNDNNITPNNLIKRFRVFASPNTPVTDTPITDQVLQVRIRGV